MLSIGKCELRSQHAISKLGGFVKYFMTLLVGFLILTPVTSLQHRRLDAKAAKENDSQTDEREGDATAAVGFPRLAEISGEVRGIETISFLRQQSLGSGVYELVTTYEGGWIQDGVMFDVRTIPIYDGDNTVNLADWNNRGIVVLGFDILTPLLDEPVCIEIYTKEGTFEGHDTQSSSWKFLGSVSVEGQGKNRPTHIPVGSFDPTHIPMNSTRAFYITTQNESLRYTAFNDDKHRTGIVFASGTHQFGMTDSAKNNLVGSGMSVEILTGIAKNYPFAESWPDRVFNGAILYRLGQDLELSTVFNEMNETQVQESENAKKGYYTCDVVTTKLPPSSPVSQVRFRCAHVAPGRRGF